MTLLTDGLPLAHVEPIDSKQLVGDKIQPGNPLFGLIWINPCRMHGTPCFYGGRVPIQNLFDCLAVGQSLDEFLDDFEGVSREQAMAVLGLAAAGILAELDRL
jgi:uncharacterized protein (DUF433 family)